MYWKRLNIIKNSDLIYAIKEGKVIEKGTHDELIAKKGYYASVIKSEIKKEVLGVKVINKEKDMRKISITTSYLVGQTLKYELGQEEEDKIEFILSKIFELIKDNKLSLIMDIISGLLFGAIIPIRSLTLGKLTTGFALKDNDKMLQKVLKWALILLLITVIGALCNYLKSLKIGEVASSLVSRIRKILFKKYLQLHVGFFDFESNNPNGLLSLLSVEILYLKLFFNSILNSITVTMGIIITAIIIGFYYDWKLTLILLCFFPLSIFFSFFSGKFKVGANKKYKNIRIEATSYFSECVTNTKTIFCFNFQESAIEIYKNILEKETNDYIKDSVILCALTAAGDFLS